MSHQENSSVNSSNGQGSNGHAHPPLTTSPLPASKKVHIKGNQTGVLVPMREITLTTSENRNGNKMDELTHSSPPSARSITVYDTSGPYTDPSTKINIRQGLRPVRKDWILSRQDVDELPDVSSDYGRQRANDPSLQDLRFSHIRKPLRAKPGHNVTQMHYARMGMVTPEMEYIAIRETQLREAAEPESNRKSRGIEQHPGQA